MCDFIPSSCFRKVIGRMRRVNAISDYLKSKRKDNQREKKCICIYLYRRKEGGVFGDGGRMRGRRKRKGKKKERETGKEKLETRLRIAEGYCQILQVISSRASTWQIDFVHRSFNHISSDPAVITTIAFESDRRKKRSGPTVDGNRLLKGCQL